MFDIILQNGQVADGSGAPLKRADVAITRDTIVAVGDLRAAQAGAILDVAGCVVAPGFVDMHSHADNTLPILPTADSLVYQGITTAVVGQCGDSPAPLLPETRAAATARRTMDDARFPWERISTFASFLELLREMGTSLNTVPLVGQGIVREAVMGMSADAPTAEQLARMQAEVAQAMDEGAVGFSTGLIYAPCSYATTEEIIALTRPVGERGGLYFSHIRSEGDALLEALGEAIRIGRETGARVEISHFKAAGWRNWPKAPQALELIDRARAEGLDVSADMYPYLAGSSGLAALLPDWAYADGMEAALARLADQDTRRRMIPDMQESGSFRTGEWDKILIASSPRQRAYEGRSVSELAASAGVDPYTWVFDTLLETGLHITMITFMMAEENAELQLRRPWMMIGTDAFGCATEGPLSHGKPHPRNYGTFPRVLAHDVRERGVLSLEEAVHRMTGLPAHKLGWTDRGLLREGYRADMVVFDPATVVDRATFQKPHQYPAGMPHVLVNGQFVIRDGAHTGARPGRVLGR